MSRKSLAFACILFGFLAGSFNSGTTVNAQSTSHRAIYDCVPTDAPPDFAISKLYDYGGGSNILYIGWALSSGPPDATKAVWAIQKFTYSGSNLTQTQWAVGSSTFANIWNNRASLTYY